MRRTALLLLGALATGLAITYVDSRPTWDDTGVTVFALLIAVVAWASPAPRRYWPVVAALVILPLPLLETTLL